MVLGLRDYVGLTERAAAQQWAAILQRAPVPAGGRQEAFTPVETLLCFGLGLADTASRSAAGNINIPESSPDAQRLARLFKRTPKSLAAKLANLDGRRPHGAKNEQELWIHLTEDPYLFESLYASILTAGRARGLDNAVLPDFLGHDEHQLAAVRDADRVSNHDLREGIEPELVALRAAQTDLVLADTERALLGTARVGQQQFARKVLNNAGFQCVFCGLSMRLNGLPSARMLVASHIKPWRASAAAQRVDPGNGLAACPTHDAAFEAYLFSVEPGGGITKSPALEAAIQSDERVRHNFGRKGLAERLVLPTTARPPGREYIDWHFAQTNVMVEFVGAR